MDNQFISYVGAGIILLDAIFLAYKAGWGLKFYERSLILVFVHGAHDILLPI